MRKIHLLLCFYTLVIAAQPIRAQVSQYPPLSIGHTRTLSSKVLGVEKTINIHLPEGYGTDTTHYPVIYLPDGAIDEDFLPIVGLTTYASYSWVNYLKPCIVVGIVNTDRRHDFTTPSISKAYDSIIAHSGGSKSYIEFLKKELFDFIDKNYTTSNERIIIGESLGGLLATEILFTHPEMFSRYYIISPSLWWNDGAFLKCKPDLSSFKPHQSIDVFLAVGKEGEAPGPGKHIMEKDAEQLKNKLQKDAGEYIQLHFAYMPEETHATISHPALLKGLKLMAPQR